MVPTSLYTTFSNKLHYASLLTFRGFYIWNVCPQSLAVCIIQPGALEIESSKVGFLDLYFFFWFLSLFAIRDRCKSEWFCPPTSETSTNSILRSSDLAPPDLSGIFHYVTLVNELSRRHFEKRGFNLKTSHSLHCYCGSVFEMNFKLNSLPPFISFILHVDVFQFS